MAAFGAFEPSPRLAVAVSGGADSLALCLLAREWASAHGGSVVALTCDHGLREEAGREAAQTAHWLHALGIPHETLPLRVPPGNTQESAREARYAALSDYALRHGIFHVLAGHHQGDQAETLLLRLQRGSGIDGLSAMPPSRPLPCGRLLRPLLDIPPETLRDYLRTQGQPWLEDPSNQNFRYRRNALRAALAELGDEDLTSRLCQAATHHARARTALENETARFLARHALLYPEGYAALELSAWRALPEELRLRALKAAVETIGGLAHPPRFESLARAARALAESAEPAFSLCGCLIGPSRRKSEEGTFLITREPAAVEAVQPLAPGKPLFWDGRFRLILTGAEASPLHAGALGPEWAARLSRDPRARIPTRLTRRILATLPALWRLEAPVCVPHIGFHAVGEDLRFDARFFPSKPFAVVSSSSTMAHRTED